MLFKKMIPVSLSLEDINELVENYGKMELKNIVQFLLDTEITELRARKINGKSEDKSND